MKDLLRFDTVVAICALLMSSVTAGAMVYQTRVLQDQFSATVWPYLAVTRTYGKTHADIRLVNEGVGPALIRSAQLSVDGKPVSGWTMQFYRNIVGPAASKYHGQVSLSSVDGSMAVRAGEERTLMSVDSNQPALIQHALAHTLTLAFCYCSINQKCWSVSSSGQSDDQTVPRAVGRCTANHAIGLPTSLIQ